MNVGDYIKHKSTYEEFEIISRDGYKGTFKIRCVRTTDHSRLMEDYIIPSGILFVEYEVIKYGSKPLDKAFADLSETFKANAEGKNIHVDEWDKLYCSCDCITYNTVRVLHKPHKICNNCKKEKI